MPEGILCNKTPIQNEEELKRLLADTRGRQYYAEMQELEVDRDKLRTTLKNTFRSRFKTWLEICARCGMCADSCFLYTVNNRDPKQVPSYKIHSTLGEIVRRKGDVDGAFMRQVMEVAWSQCTCCNRCGQYCPHGIDRITSYNVCYTKLLRAKRKDWAQKGCFTCHPQEKDAQSYNFV